MTALAPSPRAGQPELGFDAAYDYLQTLRPRGIRLGLERVRRALDRLGAPHERLRAVTIAGTNGKGSTAAFLASILHASGHRVGLYTSPHLFCPTERIKVGGLPILPDAFARWTARVQGVIEGADGGEPVALTFFEALTVMALGYFVEREVDVVVLEVGLGGRLDATAVVPPLVSVITPIGLDHQAFLGDTLERIAAEKAGIIQPGSTVVCNVAPRLFREVIGPTAFELRCPIRRAGVDYVHQWLPRGFRYRGWIHRLGPVRLGLRGVHQGDNAALACAAAESLAAHGFAFKAFHIADGLVRARHPGRLERREPMVDVVGRHWPALLIDAAHNPMGAEVLAKHIQRFLPERPRALVFTTRPDKDAAAMMAALAPQVDLVILTEASSTVLHGTELVHHLRLPRPPLVVVEPDLDVALDLARRKAEGVVIAGSIYMLGEVMPKLPATRLEV